MPVNPQIATLLDIAKRADAPEYWELEPAAARAEHARRAGVFDAEPRPVHARRDVVAVADAVEVPVRVYQPRPSPEPLPVLVWMHGGGHVVGSVESYDAICTHFAAGAECIVVSVDYRLAPEHKFPAAVDDAYGALRWVVDNAPAYGGDPARIAVGGDSAGGNLAAVCALLARDAGLGAPVFQLLVYPATAPRPDSPSHEEFAEGHLLTRRVIDWFQNHYVRVQSDRDDFRFAPLLAPDHRGLPDALVIVAECDPLRDEGIAYAQRLRDGGAEVELACYPGMIHAFVSMSSAVDAGREALEHCARALRDQFSR